MSAPSWAETGCSHSMLAPNGFHKRPAGWLGRFISAALAAYVLILSLPALAGTIVTREFSSTALGRIWSYAVYLPSGYETSNLKYPVLYLLHGNGGNLYTWANDGRIQSTTDALISSGEIPPVVIVMPDAGTSWFVDRKEKMETAVIEDLIPDVQKHLNVLTTRSARLVGGLSMGGYGAMRLALKYPEMFAAAALLSPAIYNPEPPENSSARRVGVFGSPEYDSAVWKAYNYPALWDGFLAKRMPVPMYINSGDDDDFFIESEAVQFYELLRKNKQPAELRIVDGAHVWPVWESTIGEAMKYIFHYSARPAMER
jgi:enterochelin esterase-like enzyme